MLALGRLLRLSLMPSAAADVLVGVVIGSGGHWPGGGAPFWLLAASLCIYHGALALNDWADREDDRHERPDRPLASGAIRPATALGLSAVLILGGGLLAFGAGSRTGLWMGVVASLAVAYDLCGRGPLLGPLLLGLCRAGNLGAGLLLASWQGGQAQVSANPAPALLAPALLYGAYVFVVSRLGRLEDREDPRPLGQRPARALNSAALLLAATPLLALVLPGATAWGAVLAAFLAWPAAKGLARAARRREPWTRAAVGANMGLALRRLLIFTASCALIQVEVGPAPAIVVVLALAGYPASFALRRVFPPS
jgi:4-hydroxybenzoate polyprenyltransferase